MVQLGGITGRSDDTKATSIEEINTIIEKATVSGTIDGGTSSYVGGIIGNGMGVIISKCKNEASIQGSTKCRRYRW